METALKHIIATEGFKPVFEYLKSRVELKFSNMQESGSLVGYEAVPFDHNKILAGLEWDDQAAAFLDAVEWYLQLAETEYLDYILSSFLSYLNPSKFIREPLFTFFGSLIKQHKNDKIKLNRLSVALEIFEEKNELIIDLVADLYEIGNATFSNDEDFIGSFNWNCRQAIANVGGKSGTAGEPFPVDIAMKALIETELFKYDNRPSFSTLLKRILQGILLDINDSSYRNDKKW